MSHLLRIDIPNPLRVPLGLILARVAMVEWIKLMIKAIPCLEYRMAHPTHVMPQLGSCGKRNASKATLEAHKEEC